MILEYRLRRRLPMARRNLSSTVAGLTTGFRLIPNMFIGRIEFGDPLKVRYERTGNSEILLLCFELVG